METIISIQSIKSLDQIFDQVDRGENILLKKGRSIYQLQKKSGPDKPPKREIQAYINSYRKTPESSGNTKVLTQLAADVLAQEDW